MSLHERFGHSQLTEHESKQLLREYDIPVLEESLATTPEEAEDIAEEIGLPVIMKVESRDIQHKTEAGGVIEVEDKEDIRQAYNEIKQNIADHDPEASFDGVLVGEVLEGNEFIVGLNEDPQFGTVMMFGLGGIYVEVFEDVRFSVVPADEWDIRTMIEELQARPLLDGVRGQPAADIDGLVEVLGRISDMAQQEPEIEELDINPLFIHGDMIRAADALIKLGDTDE